MSTRGIRIKTFRKIWHRDEGYCIYCEKLTNPNLPNYHPDSTNYDHIIPIIKLNPQIHLFDPNGTLNMVMACHNCNLSKGKKDVIKWCKEQNIEVPNIVINLLNKQKEQINLIFKRKGG